MSDLLLPLAFRTDHLPETIVETLTEVETDNDTGEFGRIRCPKCGWHPRATSRWYCGSNGPPENFAEGCGTSWNTFTTGGRCPGCRYQWQWTACLRCHRWSRHSDWYVEDMD